MLALAAVPGAWSVSQAPGALTSESLELRAVRFYRGSGPQTLIDGFCRVPLGMLDRLTRGADAQAAYRFSVVVSDSAGAELLSESWTQTVAARMLSVSRGSTVEYFHFAVRPGRYTVDVAVTDSATGRVARQRAEVAGFAESPGASDLMLATDIRTAGGGDTTARAGEIRKGSLLLQASGRPALTPQQAKLGYYLEIYRQRPETVTVGVRVQTPAGQRVVAAPEQRIPVQAGGGATRGMLDLAGLPPGGYQLVVSLGTADTAVERVAEFAMSSFDTEAALAAADVTPPDVFERLNEAALDTLYMPLIYLMTAAEKGVYPGLTVEGKRSYLRQFWARRDPTAGTPRNEEQEAFYARIAEANRRFREGGAAEIPGWRTDRGRIFIRYGAPDELLQRPEAGSTRPYEAWKYTRTRPLKYVFLDQTGFGNYALIWTDDRREPSRPNWEALLGPEGIQDVMRF